MSIGLVAGEEVVGSDSWKVKGCGDAPCQVARNRDDIATMCEAMGASEWQHMGFANRKMTRSGPKLLR